MAKQRRPSAASQVFEFPDCKVTIRVEAGVMAAHAERLAPSPLPLSKAERRKVLIACARANACVVSDERGLKFELA